MTDLFPTRIETDRLRFRPLDETDTRRLWSVFDTQGWRERATTQMPWFRLATIEELRSFQAGAADQWADGDTARYTLFADGEPIGVTGFGPEWDAGRAGSGVVLHPDAWGAGYGTERARVFVELTFDRYGLDTYYATCAATNDRSRRMIEGYVTDYGGRHEGVIRNHSGRPDGSVTDQHRFSITRREYETAVCEAETTFETG